MPPEQEGLERLPPQSREAERCVLGSMLRDNTVIGDVVQIVRTEYFYLDAHQKIYQAIVELYEKGHPIDLVILADLLNEKKHIEDIGGYPYLGQLWDAAPTAANVEYYARIVHDKAIVRNLIHAGTEILRDAYEQTMPADDLLETAERKILDVAQLGVMGQTYTLERALGEAYDRIDQRFHEDQTSISGLPTGFVDLDEKTAGLQKSELIIIAARPSCGKCLAHDAEIVLEDGSVVTIEEVYRRRRARLFTLHGSWRFGLTEPSAYVDDGVREVYRVTTRLGRRVETTACHPFLTLDGWRPLAELRPGTPVAVPRRLDVFGREPLRECEVKLLAYLIGDGGPTDTTPEFTNADPRVRADFTAAVEDFGAVKVRRDDGGGTRTPTLCVAGDPAFIAEHRQWFATRLSSGLRAHGRSDRSVAQSLGVSPALVCIWKKGACVPAQETFASLCTLLEADPDELAPEGLPAISRSSKNPLTLWLEKQGLWGKAAREKVIPPAVFRLPREQLSLFLNRLFATDGWATVMSAGMAQVGYGTVSERLARQVQHLLLRFGVLATLRARQVLYRGTRRPSWQLEITHQDSLRTFLAEIGIFGKEAATARVRDHLDGKRFKVNRDLVPAGVWDRLARAKGDESWRSLGVRLGRGEGANLHVGRRGLSRPRLRRFAEALGSQPLQELADSEVYWDEIVSIAPAGRKQVYDLTIDGTHNFVADDVCVHNTAFALNIARHIALEDSQPVFFVSLEQSRIELAERLLCSHARVNGHNLRKGTVSADDMQKIIEASGDLRRARMFIDDTPSQGMLRIAANARRLKLRESIKLVIIDYLQLIEPDNRRDSRQEQVSNISRRLKFLARDLNIPVIALAQVNRASEDRGDHTPRLADLRESGAIEQDADTVMLLHRPEMYEPGQNEGIIEIHIAKQRNGPTGKVDLTYIKQFMRFENFAVDGHFGYNG